MLKTIHIQNFKSIQQLDLQLEPLNILIGPNGAGKSNFISLFKFLESLFTERLSEYIPNSGGINNFLFNGFPNSRYFTASLEFEAAEDYKDTYEFAVNSDGERHFVGEERLIRKYDNEYNTSHSLRMNLQLNPEESIIKKWKQIPDSSDWVVAAADSILKYFKRPGVFHFHDTSDNAQIKLPQDIEDVYFLKNEAENLAPFLMHLREHHYNVYYQIVETVRLIYPQFSDFELEESPFAKGKVVLRWRESTSGQIFHARQMSDGTLRFICLATLLLQPKDSTYVPPTILLDEPELGLHPFAIQVLADLINKAIQNRQVIIATQSVNLINYFAPKDLIVVERGATGASNFSRKKDEDFEQWLEDYSLGQLWENNFLGGRP